MSRPTRDGIAEPVSRDHILRRERGRGNNIFPCSADHVQAWQPYPYSRYVCDHTYIISGKVHAMLRPCPFDWYRARSSYLVHTSVSPSEYTGYLTRVVTLPSKSIHTSITSCIVVSTSPASPLYRRPGIRLSPYDSCYVYVFVVPIPRNMVTREAGGL